MIRISVKTDNSATRKIKLSPVADSDAMYRVEIDRQRVNKTGQRESVYSREDVLGMVCDELGWDFEQLDLDPVPPLRIKKGARVTAKAYDTDLTPRRIRTWTVSAPFLDWRGVWRIFVMGEDQPVKLAEIKPE
jgi:hypothetical protein